MKKKEELEIKKRFEAGFLIITDSTGKETAVPIEDIKEVIHE